MPANKNSLRNLSTTIPQVFQDCQKSTANHRKNVATLRKIQEQCAAADSVQISGNGEGSSRSAATSIAEKTKRIRASLTKENGEQAFNQEFIRNLNKLLAFKKKDPCTDKVIKFVGSFVQFTLEKEIEAAKDNKESEKDQEPDICDTISSRFVESIIGHIIKGIDAKDKNLRLRVCQLIVLFGPKAIDVISEGLFEKLKKKLIERVRDKEVTIRAQAVIALSKFQSDSEQEVTDKMLNALQYDPSPEVRRAALLHINYYERTIPFALERARDIDQVIRKNVFAKVMEDIGDFRILKIEDREKLLHWGLTDRDPAVKQACIKMLSTVWIEQADNNLLEFLERLDVVSSSIAKEALLAFFAAREDLTESLQFNDSFWDDLTVEKAFLVRVFGEFCKEDNGRFDDIMPEVTRLAFYIQKYNNCINDSLEEDQVNYEFIVGQLLIIAGILDYSDEVGRRKMFTLLREMLMLPQISDDHIELIMGVMKKTTINEKDFTRSMIEIISDLRESYDEISYRKAAQTEDELTVNMSHISINPSTIKALRSPGREISQERPVSPVFSDDDDEKDPSKAMLVDLKCLQIVRCMLEINSESLRDNPSVYGLLNDLVAPSVQSHEPLIREMGVQCLGLSCLLDQTLARENLLLFIHCAKHGNESLKAKSLMVIFDILMAFGYTNMGHSEQIQNLINLSLNDETPEVQAVAVEGVAKLMLSKVIQDNEILQKLVVLYFNSETIENLRLRQCLSYFLPVYCHSSHKNQKVMQQIFVPAFMKLNRIHMNKNKNKEMTSPIQIAQQLIDWTNPNQIVKSETNQEDIDYGLQAEIAIDILKELFLEQNRETRKLLCQILLKIHIDENANILRLKKLAFLTGNLKQRRPLKDAIAKNAVNKFENSLLRYFDDSSEALDDDEIAQLDEIKAFVEDIEDDDDYSSIDIPIRTSRARSSKATALANLHKEIDDILDEDSSEES
ncbi:11036_t:CDS:10 [Ambispora leptoticha]|uniref:11036_t:CDS:1 n=1 Tax=Ambispora leptoticha TaxID=144679 RepID=A0A9N8ZH28_9GLOM|nr:11036_t:CDS:10 [Ambispora leptoticha]